MQDNGQNNFDDTPEVTGVNGPAPASVRGKPGFPVWLRDRSESCDLFDFLIAGERKRTGLPEGTASVDLLGKALWVTFVLVIISGIGLLAGYLPTITGAFSSVEHIQTSFPLGWWLRGVHKWGTDLFIILAVCRLIRLAYRRAYKSPGEFTWLAAIGILAIGVVTGLTGYLLVWHQRAFWMGEALTGPVGYSSFDAMYPLGGLGLKGSIATLILGGDVITQSVLRNIFALHIVPGFLIILAAFFWRMYPGRKVPKVRHFSTWVPMSLVWTVIGGLTILALILPPPLGGAVDGFIKPHPIFADWYLLPLYELLECVTPGTTLTVLIVVSGIIILLPWVDRSAARGPRPSVTALILAGLATWLIFTIRALGWPISGAGMLGLTALVWLIALVLGIIAEYKPQSSQQSEPDGEVADS